MRLQLQSGANTLGIPMVNIPETGVTVGQVGVAVMTLWQNRRTVATSDYDNVVIKGMSYVTRAAKDIFEAGGVESEGRKQLATYQWDRGDRRGANAVSARGSTNIRKYYRVDFENLRGKNLFKP